MFIYTLCKKLYFFMNNSNKLYDLVVIGAGSGGVRAARISASYGAKVAVIEEDRPGGTCVLRGCIPKKLMVYASEFNKQMSDAKKYGWKIDECSHDWDLLNKSLKEELDRLAGIYDNILKNSGCTIIKGVANFISPTRVKVNNNVIEGKKLLISTGGRSWIPDISGVKEHAITSNEALKLPKLPKNISILGSGYIAIEFAFIFRGFGSNVNLIYRSDLPLRGFDNEIRGCLEKELLNKGIKLYPKTKIKKVSKNSKLEIELDDGRILSSDELLVATGRKANTNNLKLENIGVEISHDRSILVNENSRTNIETVFAIGDVTDRINLTPVALGEGHAFADREFGNKKRFFEYDNVPCAVFSQPPISFVGLTEEEAVNQGINCEIYTSNFKPLKNTISGNTERSFMKLIVRKEDNVVIGAHMIGSDAPEIMQSIAIAVKAKLKKSDFDLTVGIHPSAAEEFVTMRSQRD